jgi:elongator complex protein 1
MELKIGAGRKGTVNEEEYLLNSLAKLVRRLDGTRSEQFLH